MAKKPRNNFLPKEKKQISFDFKKLPLLIVVVALVVIFTVYSKSLKRETVSNTEGFVQITSVPGITFDVEKAYADVAQAVIEISENVNFLDYQTYTYKNGEDTYLLFNIRRYIAIAKKGTEYKLSEGLDNLKYKSLDGIWFNPTDKVTSEGNKYTVPVIAEVVITNKVYNDYTGYLTTIEENGEEWTMFIGYVEKEDKTLSHTVASMCLSNTQKEAEDIYTVDIDEPVYVVENTEPTNDEIIDPIIEDPIDEPIVDDPIEEPIEEPIETLTEEPIEEPEEIPVVEPIEEIPIEEPVEIPIEEPVITIVDNGKETFAIQSNQKEVERESDKAYSSDIYSMLSVGDTGLMNLISDSAEYTEAYVKPKKILDRKETQSRIQQYINRGCAYYEDFEIPKGSHLEACVYDVKFTTEDTYLNITLKGLDGNKLVYQGIAYSTRTYDIIYDDNKVGWNNDRIVYYYVPNGCTEYVLQFGDGNGEEIKEAYYKIG